LAAKLPPTSTAPLARAAVTKPRTIASRDRTASRGGASSERSANIGAPPIAARSLTLTRKARRPSAVGDAQPARKWTFSIRASVVSMSARRPGRTTAASSPGPTTIRPRRRSPSRSRRNRAIHACSPTSRRRRTPTLAKHRFDLLEDALRERMHFLARQACELLQQGALTGAQLTWRLDDDPDDLIAASVPVELGPPATLQAEDLTRLGASRDFHLGRATERRDVDLR